MTPSNDGDPQETVARRHRIRSRDDEREASRVSTARFEGEHPILSILLVCTANICRSPFARFYLDARLRALQGAHAGAGQDAGSALLVAGVEIDLFSRGVLARDGDEMDPNMVEIAVERRLEPWGHTSAPITTHDIERADLIVCMERRHTSFVTDLTARAVSKLITLRALGALSNQPLPDEVREIPDPRERLAWLLSTRGTVPMPLHDEADVPDPYRRRRSRYDAAVDLITTDLDRFAAILTQT